jgi:hypothetical protein
MTDFVLDIMKSKYPDATEQQQTAAAQAARDKAMAAGGGIAQLYSDSKAAADSLIAEAMREVMAKAKASGETEITASELIKLEAQRLAFGKAGAKTPLLHRGQYVKKYGEADFNAAMKFWGASATDLTPRKSPFAKPVRKAMREARGGTLEATPFNEVFHADEVKAPPKPKPPKLKPGAAMTMTQISQLYLTDPANARIAAARIGVTLP